MNRKNKELIIPIVSGTGIGYGHKDAFHHALMEAGIATFNHVCYSSVIPPYSTLLLDRKLEIDPDKLRELHGHRMFSVMACATTTIPGTEAVAGIGWVNNPETGGYFVEYHGHSEEEVEDLIRVSLGELVKMHKDIYGNEPFGDDPVKFKLEKILFEPKSERDKIGCALVAALFSYQDARGGEEYTNAWQFKD
ncbi:pyruvoyl-dependent arginine decarboxylase [Candidatus Woesearchaeota archaeon]|nr:pyruvoyl-dependent arginine decarboxylase [Candidatus Woesearchaeota archaeon]MBW3018119.1 pyruvoyl-dependent arginine decarboxylase [Candidatus Woesearchaeota archaeon]